MRYRYQDYPIDLLRQLLTLDELTKLFWQLVLQTGGDVDEALKWMRYLQERGLIDPAIDLGQFRKELEKRELIENRGGETVLTGAADDVHMPLRVGREKDDVAAVGDDLRHSVVETRPRAEAAHRRGVGDDEAVEAEPLAKERQVEGLADGSRTVRLDAGVGIERADERREGDVR